MSMNFWYLPKGVEDDELVGDVETTEELVQNEDKIMKDQAVDANEESKQQKEGKTNESSKEEENMTKVNETGPVVPYTAGELIGLSRDIEAMIGDAVGDVTKVKNRGLSMRYRTHIMKCEGILCDSICTEHVIKYLVVVLYQFNHMVSIK